MSSPIQGTVHRIALSPEGDGITAAPPIAWAAADTCQLVAAGADLAAAIVDSGLRVVVWRLGGGLLHRILFPQRVAQLAMQVRAADPSRASLWAVSADGAVFEQELLLDSAEGTNQRLEPARTLALTQVLQVACGESHALAVAAERIVTWSAAAPTPTPLELPSHWRRRGGMCAGAAAAAAAGAVPRDCRALVGRGAAPWPSGRWPWCRPGCRARYRGCRGGGPARSAGGRLCG
jgi:hypothetical protein